MSDRLFTSLFQDKIFAGCHAGRGLWVNDDGKGQSWRQLTNGIDRPHIYALAVRNKGQEATLFDGASPPALYRSDDLRELVRQYFHL